MSINNNIKNVITIDNNIKKVLTTKIEIRRVIKSIMISLTAMNISVVILK